MINEVHFEIASAAFLALLFFTDLFKRQLPIKKVITFQVLLCVMMLCSFSTVDYILTMRYSTSVLLNTTIYTGTMIIGLFCVMATHWHVMSLTYRLDRKTLRVKIDLCLFGIMILIIALSPWTHWYPCLSDDSCVMYLSDYRFDLFMVWGKRVFIAEKINVQLYAGMFPDGCIPRCI